jgi:cytochrome b6-f complex subunit 4
VKAREQLLALLQLSPVHTTAGSGSTPPSLRLRLLRLSVGAGHNSYGEPAYPNDILFVFPPVIESAAAAGCGLAPAAAPPLAGLAANSFLTPLEILPEWYLYAAFGMLRAFPCKAAGIASVVGLLLGLPAAPFSGELGLSFLQNPWCRPATSGASAVLTEAALLLTLGALLDVELGAPWLGL